MKRKGLKTMIISVVVITLLVLTSIVIITKSSKNDLQEVTETATIIDVTGLVIKEEIEHEHVYKTMYDESKHWEECIFCNKKQNIDTHNMSTTWATGKESCNRNNSYISVCICGFSKTGHKPCVWDGKSYTTRLNTEGNFDHIKKCSVCNEHINYSYYLNGVLYEQSLEKELPWEEPCYKSDGTRLTCDNLGTCSICKQSRTIKCHKGKIDLEKGEIYCQTCHKEFGTCSQEISRNMAVAPTTYTITTTLNLTNGATFAETSMIRGNSTIYSSTNQKVTSINSSKTEVVVTTTATFQSEYKAGYEAYIRVNVNADGRKGVFDTTWFDIYPDPIEPKIESISIGTNTNSNWEKSKEIIISGTENYCNAVNVKIVNENEEVVAEGGTNVINQAYSISFTPDIEAGEEGKTFKAIVTDSCENSTEKEFIVSKIDRIAPEPTSSNEILGDWAKSKEFTFEATDYGIGNISIGFNDVADYKLAEKNENTYTRDYKFVGDVYSPKNLNVFYKDELGNLKTQAITIDKLDNTAPTITEVRLNKNKLNITSNDRHELLGEGSGVTKYRYMTSEEKLENVDMSEYENIEVGVDEEIVISNINDKKYIYVVAEDKVGNVSETYEVKIADLELTTSVNLSTENKKGEIILEWSTYNTENKIFKVYRKKEGQEEFENISTIDSQGEMIDNLAQDLEGPDTPTITITGVKEENKIKISYNTEDKGSTYTYYVEAYDKEDDSLLLKTSNEREELVKTGVKGYYYIIDENSENTDFDINTGTYVEDENIKIELEDNGKYIHMKAVDVAGNISEVITLEIEVKSKQSINLDGGNINGEENPELEEGLVGETIELGIPEKEGYTFDGWEATEGEIDGTKYTYGIEDGEITAKWIKNSYEYKVEYYYNGEKEEKETETKEAEYESIIEKYTEKIKEGYKFEKIENLPLKITTNVDNNVIKVYYIPDENKTKEISYRVEYYKDNEKVEEDTQIENKTVQVLEDIMDVDKSKINIEDKYRGYKLDRTEPENIPSKIENEGLIKVYYIRKVGNIEVKYIDEVTGEEIEEKETITGIEGDRYNTESKDISGYELVEEPTNKSGEMKEGTITVTYKYRKLSKVIIKYIDLNSGNEIEKEEKEYKEGENYTTESKEISGYKLVETSGKVNGIVGRKEIEVIYGYKKIAGGVKVKHIDKENNEVIKEEKIEGLVGEKYNTKRLELQKYNFIEVVGNEEGKLSGEVIEVVYYYEKKQAIIEVIYEDEKGKEIYKEIIEGKVGEKYKVEVKEIENYKIINTSENIEGEYTIEEIVVKIKVEKLKVKVTINIVDEKGNIIETIEKEGNIGNTEEIELPKIDGYYTEEKSIVIEYGKENNINIVYKKMLFNIPNTSDKNIYVYIGIFVVSVIVICTVAIIIKKKK